MKKNFNNETIKDENLKTNNLKTTTKDQLRNTDQIKTKPVKSLLNETDKEKINITSFQDLIDLANKEKEVELKYDLERNVKLVSFNKGKINISFNDKLNQEFYKKFDRETFKLDRREMDYIFSTDQ